MGPPPTTIFSGLTFRYMHRYVITTLVSIYSVQVQILTHPHCTGHRITNRVLAKNDTYVAGKLSFWKYVVKQSSI